MTRPETCSVAGGAISLWMNVKQQGCPSHNGIISSQADESSGVRIRCHDTVGYDLSGVRIRCHDTVGYDLIRSENFQDLSFAGSIKNTAPFWSLGFTSVLKK